jgi:hypothetical protein
MRLREEHVWLMLKNLCMQVEVKIIGNNCVQSYKTDTNLRAASQAQLLLSGSPTPPQPNQMDLSIMTADEEIYLMPKASSSLKTHLV